MRLLMKWRRTSIWPRAQQQSTLLPAVSPVSSAPRSRDVQGPCPEGADGRDFFGGADGSNDEHLQITIK